MKTNKHINNVISTDRREWRNYRHLNLSELFGGDFSTSLEMTIVFVFALLLTSCSKHDVLGVFMTFDESPDERFAQSMTYNNQHGYDVITGMPNTYRLYAMSDVHVDGSTHNLDGYVADYLSDTTAAPFSLCLGDLIYGNNGFGKFCEHVKPVTDAGRKIYYTVGNHDLYFGQWDKYYNCFGASSYWFEVQTVGGFKDLFISLDSGNGTLGLDQRDWLEDLLESKHNQEYRHIIVFTHTHFFRINNNNGLTSSFCMEETYDLTDLFDRYDVSFVFQGHSHHKDYRLFKGVGYLRLGALKEGSDDACYVKLNIGNFIDYQFIKIF